MNPSSSTDPAKKALEDALKARGGLIPIAERSSDPNKIAHLMEKLELFMSGHQLSKQDLELLNSNSSLDNTNTIPVQKSPVQLSVQETPKPELKVVQETPKPVQESPIKEKPEPVIVQNSPVQEIPKPEPIVVQKSPEPKVVENKCFCKYKLAVSILQEKSNDELSKLLKDLNVNHVLTNLSCTSWSDANRNSAIILLTRVDTTCKCSLNGNACDCVDPDAPKESEEVVGFMIKSGIQHHNENPVELSVRTNNVVKCFHIDEERDVAIGIQLSKMNLNYVFKKPSDDVKSFHLECPHLFGATMPVLPSFVDLRSKWGTVYNQGSLGSCCSNSLSGVLRHCMKKEGKPTITPSRLFIYYNARMDAGLPLNQDTGLSIEEGYRSVSQQSACSEVVYPYNIAVFANKPTQAAYQDALNHTKSPQFQYMSIASNLTQIQQCLNAGFPLSFGTSVYESFMSQQVAQSGIVPVPNTKTEQICGGHAMSIVGYINADVPLTQLGFSGSSIGYFIVANSWSSSWGKNGFCLFPYTYMLNQQSTSDFYSPRYFA
jgi:C1A family cysteine protease